MKKEIIYKASQEVKEYINRWQNWLRSERRYSEHTVDSYSRDLALFLSFTEQHLQKTPDVSDLQNLSIRDFRAFLSYRNDKYIEKSSIARELSTLRNFFKWLKRHNVLQNSAISVIRSPRRASTSVTVQ